MISSAIANGNRYVGDHMSRPTRNTLWGCLLVLVLAGLNPCNARAEDRPFQFVTLDCLFRGQLSTTLEQGKLSTVVPKDTLAITLSSFDYDKHTAMMIGNAGGRSPAECEAQRHGMIEAGRAEDTDCFVFRILVTPKSWPTSEALC